MVVWGSNFTHSHGIKDAVYRHHGHDTRRQFYYIAENTSSGISVYHRAWVCVSVSASVCVCVCVFKTMSVEYESQ